ncbi:hypothetical protein [Gilliamella sp. BG6]|uniref:hypothetical protein n=1 Tax=unclassified Gilliamella TaxID=2685620 RepID=UPI0039872B06
MVDAIKELEEAKRKLISVEDTLLLISKKFNIDRITAAEYLLIKLSENFDFNNWYENPPCFGKRLGIATFTYVKDDIFIDVMLKRIIENDSRAFEKEVDSPIDWDSEIPF